jgi:hypothetical protein
MKVGEERGETVDLECSLRMCLSGMKRNGSLSPSLSLPLSLPRSLLLPLLLSACC